MEEYLYKLSLSPSSAQAVSLEILKNVLIKAGVSASDIIEIFDKKGGCLTVYFPDRIRLNRILKCLKGLEKAVRIETEKVFNRDWRDVWKKEFRPFKLTEKLKVVPAWLKKKERDNEIYIDTSLAFGTGMHATTQMMAVLIERCAGKFDSFLDIGTGTGILAIVAHKCGGRRIWAFDCDADAVPIAQENFDRNQCGKIMLSCRDAFQMRGKQTFDFVAANLITHTLKDLREKMIRAVSDRGYLAVSGVSAEHEKEIHRVFNRDARLRCLRILRKNDWRAFLYQKR